MEEQKTYRGLSDTEIARSRQINGANEIGKQAKPGLISKIFHIFSEPMLILLLITASIYFLIGEVSDGFIMLAMVLFVSGIEFFQERKTDKALEALDTLSALNVEVIRNGQKQVISSNDVVVGDIVLLDEGDKIPADGRILESQGLGVNESALTGESAVVYKKADAASNEHFRLDMCYAGCDVTSGSATIEIVAVGPNTEYGKIGKSLGSIQKEKTPLEVQIRKLIVACTIISLTFCVIVVVVNFVYNHGLPLNERIVESILPGITMAMATIPEEIPVVLTVFLAMGAWRLAKQNALVRNMKAVETLGAITVLCTDKTGTLTENKMTVRETFSEDGDLARISALACHTEPYDPMEIAIQEYAFNEGVTKAVYDHELIHEYIFNNEDKMMGQIWELDNQQVLCVKGAHETVMSLCDLSASAKHAIVKHAHDFARQGYRVLAVAKRDHVTKIPEQLKDNRLTFVGLIALVDPPREGVQASIEACHSAGVRVIMITGDNGETATGIAKQIGLNHSSTVITGEELESMSDEELKERVRETNIFARVYPNHKMRIVEALQSNHEVVAMTGDGVNDAPALKKAAIGIAMGLRGTNVAKEASDLILMDDNFNTIIQAIKNGRTIYENIKKAISYILVIHIPIILASLLVPLIGLPIWLLPIHIVLLELIIDPTSSIIFQRLDPDRDIMQHPPRRLNESLINRSMVVKCILQGTVLFAVAFASYYYLVKTGEPQAFASTFAFSTLVFSNIFVVYVMQSNDYAVKNFLRDLRDKVIVLINSAIVVILLLFTYVPFLGQLIGSAPLSIVQLMIAVGLAMLATLGFDLLKLGKRR